MELKLEGLEFDKQYRICKVRGCLGRGHWQPVLCLSPDGKRYIKIPMRDKIFCTPHKERIGLERGGEQLAGPVWEQIDDIFRKKGKEVPEQEYTYLEWREV